ncbi:MAG TPA: glycosyltransferase family 4 protein [Candidatus Eisenbacteria bacterium]|nr:glycosyltransferase family 4 protein [Candidatus Eisenbacteria bacterium]
MNATGRWGGVKTWTLDVAPRLVARGHAVHLFLRHKDRFADACRSHGLSTEQMTFGPDWNPVAIHRLKQRLERLRIQVVVTNVSKDNRIAGPAARALGLPILQIVGGPGDFTDNPRVRLEQRRYVTAAIVPAEAVRAAFSRFEWMDIEHRVAVLHNAVDLEFFKPGIGAGVLRQELGIPDAVPIVMTTGQLTPVKGHDTLLTALAGLPGPVLALTSRGPEETRLRTMAQTLGIAERVHFLGFQERARMPLLLEDADVVVQPSIEEGLPISVLEFMAKGKAIVATRISGIPEAIEHDREGWLVPPSNPEALRAAIATLLGNPELRSRLGHAARARAEAAFGLDTLVRRFEALLLRLVAGGRAGGLGATASSSLAGTVV